MDRDRQTDRDRQRQTGVHIDIQIYRNRQTQTERDINGVVTELYTCTCTFYYNELMIPSSLPELKKNGVMA